MKNLLLRTLIIIFMVCDIFPQGPDTLWTKRIGGFRNEAGYSVKPTIDGGFIMTGYTESYGDLSRDVYLVKTDSDGLIEWQKNIERNSWEEGNDVHVTNDGGYIIAAISDATNPSLFDAWLIKTDENGDTLWTKIFGGSRDDRIYSVRQANDSGYVMIGNKYFDGPPGSQLWLIKTDLMGNLQWEKTFGGDYNEFGYSLALSADGDYTVVGATFSYGAGDYDVWLIKTDENGNEIWNKTFGGNNEDWANDIKITTDNGYIITGYTNTFSSGLWDVWLIKTDENGNEIWNKSYGGSGWEEGYSVSQTLDGGYILGGVTTSIGAGNYDGWIVRTDENGKFLWDKTLGGISGDAVTSVLQISDGTYVPVGATAEDFTSDSDLWLIKTSPLTLLQPNGGEIWFNGSTQSIVWFSERQSLLEIELSTDNGNSWAQIADSIINSGTYDWFVNLHPLSEECLIKIGEIEDETVYDVSNSPFTIGGIEVNAPNGGEIFFVGDTTNISWISLGITDIRIELSIDSGSTWTIITSSVLSTGNYSWIVNSPDSSNQCLIRISDVKDPNIFDISDESFTIDIVSSIDDSLFDHNLHDFKLFSNYPNPFNPSTVISYKLPVSGDISLIVYDVLGNEIAILVDEYKPAGSYEVEWDASDYPSGVYFYQLSAGNYIQTKKMVLMR